MSADNLKDLLKNPDQIKQMIGLLSSLLEATGQSDDNTETEVEQPQKSAKRTKFKEVKRENKFLDMPEANMHKEDPEIAKKLYKNPPIARRRKSQLVKAKCRVCGREESVQSSLLYSGIERFKCNRCSTTPG